MANIAGRTSWVNEEHKQATQSKVGNRKQQEKAVREALKDEQPPASYWNQNAGLIPYKGIGSGSIMYSPGMRDSDIGSELRHCMVYYGYGGGTRAAGNMFQRVTNMIFPLPDGLVDEVGLEWNTEESGQQKMRALLNTLVTEGVGAGVKEIYSESKDSLNELVSKITGGARSRRDKGIVKNTHQEMYFKGINFRQFVFKHKMMPTSPRESVEAKNIVDTFKYLASPGYHDGRKYFTYPSQWEIHFLHKRNDVMYTNEYLTKIGRCVLDKVGVNYTSEGTYQSFSDGDPTVIELELSFKEIDLVTRDTLAGAGMKGEYSTEYKTAGGDKRWTAAWG